MPRVLIVEDAGSCATTLEIAFSALRGVSVTIASSGHEAWGVLESDSDHPVNALVTDLHMPRMDGFELIARVRRDPRHRGLPIIVLSGDSDPETPERVRRLGVDAFFGKPYSPAAVREKLEQLLHANPRHDI
jgi:two-component system chemotaxis response regulator CheY